MYYLFFLGFIVNTNRVNSCSFFLSNHSYIKFNIFIMAFKRGLSRYQILFFLKPDFFGPTNNNTIVEIVDQGFI